jgi:hypothetical protein
MLKLKALRDFAYSFNGISVQLFTAGQVYDFPADKVSEFTERGYCSAVGEVSEAVKDAPPAENKIAKTESKKKRK